VDAGNSPRSVAVDPTGRFAYVTNYISDSISVYTIDPSTGALTPGTAVAAGNAPASVALDPTGRFAYVANAFADTVSVFTLDSLNQRGGPGPPSPSLGRRLRLAHSARGCGPVPYRPRTTSVSGMSRAYLCLMTIFTARQLSRISTRLGSKVQNLHIVPRSQRGLRYSPFIGQKIGGLSFDLDLRQGVRCSVPGGVRRCECEVV
jgi:DNA-binding beta-propeller fold protein YncE